jgi:hypothetical protein
VRAPSAPATATILPGDQVRVVGELPASLAKYNPTILRETTFVVRYVGNNGTVDVQPDLRVDFVIETVPTANVQPVES